MQDETHNTGGSPKPKSSNLAIGILAAVIVILLIVWFQTAQAPSDDTFDNEAITELDEITNNITGSSYDGGDPADWPNYDKAMTNIQTLGVGQSIEDFVISDPNDNDIVYFASSAYNSDIEENLISIYRYNENNDNFERLFRTRYRRGATTLLDETMVPKILTVGYEDGQLILLMMDYEDGLDTCEEPVLSGIDDTRGESRNLLSMNISDPYGGFAEYTPTEEQLAEAETKEEACK